MSHIVFDKERRGRLDHELEYTDSVKTKVKAFCAQYMEKFGPVYERPAKDV